MQQAIAIHDAHIQRLRQLRISVTWQRLELMRILHETDRALSAQEIFCAHSDAAQSTPLSTIYVNLKRLEEAGIVSRIRLESENKSLYSLAAHHGPMRLVCQQCGKLHCIDDPAMTALMQRLCQAYGFTLQEYAATLETVCFDCQEQDRPPPANTSRIQPPALAH